MTCVVEPVCRNARTFKAYGEHAPNPLTGRCGRCGLPVSPYDPFAEWYDQEQAKDLRNFSQTMNALMSQLWHVQSVKNVVDLGCGTGLRSGVLVKEGWKITGVDASAEMLRIASDRLSQVVHASVTASGLKSASVETVISTWTHTDVPWPEMIQEAVRILKRHGQFIYVGGDPWLMPPPSETGIRSKVGWKQLTESELLAPFQSKEWELAHVQTIVVSDALPLILVRARKR